MPCSPHRGGHRIAASVALAVLVAGACSAGAPGVLGPDDPRMAGHPALDLPGASTIEELQREAGEEGIAAICGSGGVGATAWGVCMVHTRGVTALVPVGPHPGLVAVVSSGGADVEVPLVGVRGLERSCGEIAVVIRRGSFEVGEVFAAEFP